MENDTDMDYLSLFEDKPREALKELIKLDHEHHCHCHKCLELRDICLKAGYWREVQ